MTDFNNFYEVIERLYFYKYLWIDNKSIINTFLIYIFLIINLIPIVKLIITSLFYLSRIVFLIIYSIINNDYVVLIKTLQKIPTRLLESTFFSHNDKFTFLFLVLSYIYILFVNVYYIFYSILDENPYLINECMFIKVMVLIRDLLILLFEIFFITNYINVYDIFIFKSNHSSSNDNKDNLLLRKVVLSTIAVCVISIYLFIISCIPEGSDDNNLYMPLFHILKYLILSILLYISLYRLYNIEHKYYNWKVFLVSNQMISFSSLASNKNSSLIQIKKCQIENKAFLELKSNNRLPTINYYPSSNNIDIYFNSRSKYYFYYTLIVTVFIMGSINLSMFILNLLYLVNIEGNSLSFNISYYFSIGKKIYLIGIFYILLFMFVKIEYRKVYI